MLRSSLGSGNITTGISKSSLRSKCFTASQMLRFIPRISQFRPIYRTSSTEMDSLVKVLQRRSGKLRKIEILEMSSQEETLRLEMSSQKEIPKSKMSKKPVGGQTIWRWLLMVNLTRCRPVEESFSHSLRVW